ncbi:MAG: hypothetical protein WDW36_002468 [Sanguina aurantia]
MGDHQDNTFRPPLTTMMPPLRPPLNSILHPPGMMAAPRRPPPDELRGLSRMQAPGPSSSKGSLAPLSEDGTSTQQQTSVPPTIPRSNNPNLAAHQSAGPGSSSGRRGGSEGVKLSSWEQYWDRKDVCELQDRGSFNVYTAGDKGAVLLCLHGGGYTGLTWSLVAKQLKDRYRVVAPDLRCHGMSSTWEDEDFSKGTMAADITALWSSLFGCDPQPAPVVVVGHSMGGALAVWAAASGGLTGLAGVVVVDVVEGTAIAALPFMGTVLSHRPASFPSPEAAVSWALETRMCHNKEAAAISIPSQLRPHASHDRRTGGSSERRGAGSMARTGGQVAMPYMAGAAAGADPVGSGRRGSLGALSEEGVAETGDCDCDRQQQQQQGSSSRAGAPSPDQGRHSGGQELHGVPHGSDGPRWQQQQQQQGVLESSGRQEYGARGGSGGGSQQQLQQQQQQQQQQQRRQPVSGPLCAPEVEAGGWVWRTPLLRSEPFWREWYCGLSEEMLKLPCPKLLILAGTDRLDKALTIGQMQGRFQMVLLPQAGHAIHEDEPVKTADALLAFLKRFRVGEPAMALPKAFGVVRSLPTVAGPML